MFSDLIQISYMQNNMLSYSPSNTRQFNLHIQSCNCYDNWQDLPNVPAYINIVELRF